MPARTVGRIQTRAAFGALRRSKCRASSGPVRAVFVPVPDGDPGVFPQVGYVISRRCGSAVTRNTLRRRLRASVRDVAGRLTRGTYLVRLEPDAGRWDRAELARCAQDALLRAGRTGRSERQAS